MLGALRQRLRARASATRQDGLDRLWVAGEPEPRERDQPAIVDEHFVPRLGLDAGAYIAAGDVTGAHHLLRYTWAVQVVGDLPNIDSILDVASGAGYGSFMLARAFPAASVTGVDYDPNAVDYARQHYRAPNLTFRVGDLARWDETIGTATFDCITSFDTLEHCPHRELVLENVTRHLHSAGTLLFSTPSGAAENALRPAWEHHRIEYSTASLYDFLRRYFATIVRPDGPDFPRRDLFAQVEGSAVAYLLRLNPVVCQGPIVPDNPYR